MMFEDRARAGTRLAQAVRHLTGTAPLVLALPRGGVAVALPVARALGAPLQLWGVRKVAAPRSAELAIAAVAEGGAELVDRVATARLGVSAEQLETLLARARKELAEQLRALREAAPAPVVEGRTVILVDDGIATGATITAAAQAIRARRPQRLVIATPVAAAQALEALRPLADELICLSTPSRLRSVSQWYEDFAQVSDDEVRELLLRGRALTPADAAQVAAAPAVPRAAPVLHGEGGSR